MFTNNAGYMVDNSRHFASIFHSQIDSKCSVEKNVVWRPNWHVLMLAVVNFNH